MPARESLLPNTRIAGALLDVLARSGDVGGHARALRELGGDAQALRAEQGWLPRDALDSALRVLEPDRRLTRRVGRALVSPESLGAPLYYGGFATVEKAYRRVDQLLPREDPGGRFEATAISQGAASIHYHPGLPGSTGMGAGDVEDGAAGQGGGARVAGYCGVREGMLEAIPLCFGLLPARVRETQCIDAGAPHCSFEVEWTASPRRGLLIGSLVGLLLAGGLVLGAGSGMAPILVAITSLGCGIMGAAVGRSIDLARQLEAVAGARRGHLALLDQADQSIAEKMDELAKVESSLDSAQSWRRDPGVESFRADRTAVSEEERAERLLAVRAAEEIYGVLGPLQRSLGEIREELLDSRGGEQAQPAFDRERVGDALQRCVEESRHIQAVGAELARSGSEADRFRRAVSLADVVSRAADGLRAQLPPAVSIDLDLAEELPLIRCEPFRMEQVIYQLLRNAANATGTEGTIWATLAARAGGVELVVDDKGGGFSEEAIDEVFDPFSGEKPPGAGGLALASCYRFVEEQSGEMSIAAGEHGGTRVTVVLPPDRMGGPASDAS